MIIILVPSFILTGPVKGAIALANGLINFDDILFIGLKHPSLRPVDLHSDIVVESLGGHSGFVDKFKKLKQLLKKAPKKSTLISLCFSADVANLFAPSTFIKVSSVRSNLIVNYRMTYGLSGVALAFFHFLMLRGFDHVVCMTDAMSKHVYRYSFCKSEVIGNFIDEPRIEVFRQVYKKSNRINLVFLGSLTKRKQPDLLIKSLKELIDGGLDIHLDLIGEGPLMNTLKRMVADLNLESNTQFFGEVDEPYGIIAKADLMVMPSLSEGLSRAALESLYLGIPVVLRNVDGNAELIDDFKNGVLFNSDNDLTDVIGEAAIWAKLRDSNKCLLPDMFRQSVAVKQYLKLIR